MPESNLPEAYRPQDFDSIVGQYANVALLADHAGGKVPAPFWLFHGHTGTGKTTAARVFARTLNCESRKISKKTGFPIPCGSCPPCLEFNKKTAMNPYLVEFDGAVYSKVEDTRTILQQLRTAVPKGHYRVFIGDEIHRLSPSAFDAWLRFIENPPKGNIIVFCTSEVGKIIPTIRGRSINKGLHFTPVASPDIVQRLKYVAGAEGKALKDEEAALIAERSSGSMRDALNYLYGAFVGEGIRLSPTEEYHELAPNDVISVMNYIIRGDTEKAYWVLSKEWVQGRGLSIEQVLEVFLKHVTNMMMPYLLKYKGWNNTEIQALNRQKGMLGSAGALLIYDSLLSYVDRKKTLFMNNSEHIGILLTILGVEMSKLKRGATSAVTTAQAPVVTTQEQPPAEKEVSPDVFAESADLFSGVLFLSKELFDGSARLAAPNRAVIVASNSKQVDVVPDAKFAKSLYFIYTKDVSTLREKITYDKEYSPKDALNDNLMHKRV